MLVDILVTRFNMDYANFEQTKRCSVYDSGLVSHFRHNYFQFVWHTCLRRFTPIACDFEFILNTDSVIDVACGKFNLLSKGIFIDAGF